MAIDLMPWVILWALVTTGVLVLALWRLVVARREEALGGLHVAAADASIPELEAKIARTLVRIDFWGKTLTVISAALILAIGVAWLYNGWLKANEIVR